MAIRTSVPGDGVTAEINVTPMIDVMLVLLVIFMLTAPAMVAAVKLPEARTAQRKTEDGVTLVVTRAGEFLLEPDRRPVAESALPARLRVAYAARPGDAVMYLKADGAAPYSRVLTAIDAARGVGVRRLGVHTAA